MKILYLEDDTQLSSTIEEFLSDQGFEVIVAFDSDEALELLYTHTFDLLLFDVQVPGINGFELLQNLRDSNTHTPAIFTTSRNSIDDLSQGYNVGADDYIKKPFALKELYLRIKALLKREYQTDEQRIEIEANLFFNTNLQQLIIKNEIIELNQKEALLLKVLLRYRKQCVSYETIFQTVWGYDKVHSEQSLRTYIKNLRKYLGKKSIISIKKQGYIFD